MINDDTLQESDDSFCDLYSTAKVTNTYKELLHKLISSGSAGDSHEVKSSAKKLDDCGNSSISMKRRSDFDEVVNLCESRSCSPVEEVLELEDNQEFRTSIENQVKVRSARSRKTEKCGPKSRKKTKKSNPEQELVVIESDEEEHSDCADDIVNYEVFVKVLWKSVHVKRFKWRRFQKFSKIFEHFMEEEKVPMDKIFLSLGNTKIEPNDTPESINLQVFDFIEGGVLSNSISNDYTNKNVPNMNNCNDKDSVSIKIQDKHKKVLKFCVNKNEPLKTLMIRYAEQIDVPLNKIKFLFDGETIKSSHTPNSLGFENDEMIDVKVIE